jgi:ketosteroid isomerase-like protein
MSLRLRSSLLLAAAACAVVWTARPLAQPRASGPPPFEEMLDTERAFAERALVIGWKQAFLEYFADDAVGFDSGAAGLARTQISDAPDPPPDMRLLWEPRAGDISADGDLGFLTGPSQSIRPSRNSGRPLHQVYATVWKRQRDGRFAVVMDVGVPVPRAAAFAPGVTRLPHSSRYAGDYDENTPPLRTADGILNSALRTGQAKAFRERLAPGARLHRPGVMPLTGEPAILAWLASQPSLAASDTRFAETAASGDFGYTWGTYIEPAGRRGLTAQPGGPAGAAGRGRAARQEGFYVRVWVRERNRQWKVALDVIQPQ